MPDEQERKSRILFIEQFSDDFYFWSHECAGRYKNLLQKLEDLRLNLGLDSQDSQDLLREILATERELRLVENEIRSAARRVKALQRLLFFVKTHSASGPREIISKSQGL